jgi:hypothetical protein
MSIVMGRLQEKVEDLRESRVVRRRILHAGRRAADGMRERH